MKILITGAGGYIGSIATYLFLQRNYQVVTLDNYATGFRKPLLLLQEKFGQDKLRIYETDLKADFSTVFEKEPDIDAVVDFAALCNVEESLSHPELYFANDTWATLHLVETMTKYGINKLVFSSTCAVYGESKYVPIDENHPINPKTPYGEAKYLAERGIDWYRRLKNLNFISLRYFNVCGASDDSLLGDAKKPSFHLMQNAIRGALGIAPFSLTCPEVATPDKTPIRDYLNVVDLVEAHILALQYVDKGGTSEYINLGTGYGNSVMEIVHLVEKVTGKKVNFTIGKTRLGDPAKLVAANDKAKKLLGWQPKRSLEDSVKTLVTWYNRKPYGWEN